MATVSASIKISSAVSATATATNNTATIYTCPANSYAIVNVAVSASGIGTVSVDGKDVIGIGAASSFPSAPGNSPSVGCTVYVGPGQALTISSGGAFANVGFATGVCFTNS